MTLCSNQYALAIGVNDIDAHFCVCSSLVLSPGLFVILFLGRSKASSKWTFPRLKDLIHRPGSRLRGLGFEVPGSRGGGGGKKKLKPVAPYFFFFCCCPPPPRDPRPGSFGFGTWAFSFSLYMHCARLIFPAEAFSSVCILCIIGSILYTAWIFVGLTKISFICIR